MLFKNVHNVPGIPRNLFCSPCTYAGYTIHFTNCFGIKVLQGTSGMPGTQFISQTLFWKSNYCLFKCRVHNSFQKLFWTSKYSRVHPACQVHNSFHKLFLEKKNYYLFNSSRCTWHARCTRHIHFTNCFGHQSTPGYIRHAGYTIHFTNSFGNQTIAFLIVHGVRGMPGVPGMPPACRVHTSFHKLFWTSKYSKVHPAWRVCNSFHKLFFGNQTIAFLILHDVRGMPGVPGVYLAWVYPGTRFISQTVLDIKVLLLYLDQACPGMPSVPSMPGTQSISQTVLDIKVLQGTSGMPGTQFISQTVLDIKVLLL